MATYPDSEAKDAYEVLEKEKKIIKYGVDYNEVHSFYEKWACNYNQDVAKIVYHPPARTVEQVLLLFNHDKNIRILDVAAGTGFVGIELQKSGFKNIDAVDGSQAMLEVAEKTGVYKNIYCKFIGPVNSTEIPTETYDVLVTTGSFVPSHLDEKCFEELIRITKTGGYIIIVMNELYFKTEPQYTTALEKGMDELVEQGMWTKIERTVVPAYREGNGIVYIMKK